MARKTPPPNERQAPSEPRRGRIPGGLVHRPFEALRQMAGLTEGGDTVVPASPVEPRTPPPHGSIAAPEARVTVRRERSGRGGKTVTVVEGPGLSGTDLSALARDMARSLGVGARLEETTIVVQGDQVDRLLTWLEQRGFRSLARGN
jgi:translation initiation factor 1 (eIF-1/SUI1)